LSVARDPPEAVQRDPRAGQPRRAAQEPGRLVAVAGLCGGAGASTLAYLLCCAAIADGERPVLCLDAAGRAGIAAYAGTQPGISFAHASIELQAGRLPAAGRLFASSKHGVRMLCSTPSLERPLLAAGGASRLLADARSAHALTVIDCGTLTGELERLALSSADHALLVIPATRSGIQRGGPLAAQARELCSPGANVTLIARSDRPERTAPVSELAPIAEPIGATIVLCPHLGDLRERPVEPALERAQVTLQALRRVVAR
jgi:hypothetical protein